MRFLLKEIPFVMSLKTWQKGIHCLPGSYTNNVIYIYIYIYRERERERERERYNKSTMPENAEKYFYGPTGIRTHDLGNTA